MTLRPKKGHVCGLSSRGSFRTADLRDAHIASACGDDVELKAHVESLLASHERAAGFLATSETWTLEAAVSPSLEGLHLGPYLLTDRIGAGGMGEVYKARDTRLDRAVAIKVLTADVAPTAGRGTIRARGSSSRGAQPPAHLHAVRHRRGAQSLSAERRFHPLPRHGVRGRHDARAGRHAAIRVPRASHESPRKSATRWPRLTRRVSCTVTSSR